MFKDKVEKSPKVLKGWSWCVSWECGECTDGCLDSFVVGDASVERCDTYCGKYDVVVW